MAAYRCIKDDCYLRSAKRAFDYYSVQYFNQGRVAPDLLVYFANWQSQSCRLLSALTHDDRKREVADYMFRMHAQILAQGFSQKLQQHPGQQVSVEVACALKGLNDA